MGDCCPAVVVAGQPFVVVVEPRQAPAVVVAGGRQGPAGPPGPPAPGSGDAPLISTDAGNRLVVGSDNGLYVRDDLNPDPLAYYILAKG